MGLLREVVVVVVIIIILCYRNVARMECKNKCETSNNKGNLEPSQNIPEKYLSNITGKQEIKELQKTAILGTAHTLRTSTDVKLQ